MTEPTAAERRKARFASQDRAMAEIHPPIADFNAMRIRWHPYHTFAAEPGYRSATLTTDEYGFRPVVLDDGAKLGYRDFIARPEPKGVICGSSTIYGVGQPDEATLQSRLTARRGPGGAIWFSLSQPLLNVFQQRTLFDLFAPDDCRYCVFIPQRTEVCLGLIEDADLAPYPPVFGHVFKDERRRLPAKRHRLSDGTPVNDPDRVFTEAWHGMRRQLAAVALLCRFQLRCRLLVALGPVMGWLEKPTTPEEARLAALAHQKYPGVFGSLIDPSLRRHWRALGARIETLAGSAGADFIDLGEDTFFRGPAWLFLDHIHPAAAATDHIAGRIAEWAGASTQRTE